MSEINTQVCAKCGSLEFIHDCVELTRAEMWAIEIENELAVIVDPDGDKIVMLDDIAEFIAEKEEQYMVRYCNG